MRSISVDKGTDEIIKAVATAGILGTLAATIRALLAKNESMGQRIRTFFAGVCMSVCLGFILRNSGISEMWKEIFVGMSAAFISSIWPILERIAKKYVQKKGDVEIHDNP